MENTKKFIDLKWKKISLNKISYPCHFRLRVNDVYKELSVFL